LRALSFLATNRSGEPLMLRKVLLGLGALLALVVVLVVVLSVVVALQPAEYAISRSATLPAPPEQVFAQVNDFRRWDDWSPWAKLDPDAEAIFEGPDAGVGARFLWSGNDAVGEGSMTILESVPHERIAMRLAFVRPMEDECLTEFTFAPAEDDPQRTVVTWTMSGHNNFMGRLVCLFINLDAMLGEQFEQGLAAMGERAAAASAEMPIPDGD
jgi:uncharacterized protein YndB with AHSA1/START domain